MALVRNISGGDLAVPELGWRTVEADEVVEVPDDRLDGYTCQSETWADESKPAPKSTATKGK